MPHITVDYSAHLEDVFDRHAFVQQLHPLVVQTADSTGVCKTFVRPAPETYVGDTETGRASFVHVEIGLLPGRDAGLHDRLSEAVLALLDKHLAPDPTARRVHSVEVRSLAPSYALSVDP